MNNIRKFNVGDIVVTKKRKSSQRAETKPTKYKLTNIEHVPSIFPPQTEEQLMYVFTINSGEETLHVLSWQIEHDKETHREKQLEIVLNNQTNL